jgi:hypothetical protein
MLLEVYGIVYGCYWKFMDLFMDVTGYLCKFMDLLHGCYWIFLEINVFFLMYVTGNLWIDFLMDVTGNLCFFHGGC